MQDVYTFNNPIGPEMGRLKISCALVKKLKLMQAFSDVHRVLHKYGKYGVLVILHCRI